MIARPLRVAAVVAHALVAMAPARAQDPGPVLPVGTSLSVRLLDSVVGDRAMIGRRIRARVIAPVFVEARIALVSGATLSGRIADAGVDVTRGRRHYVDIAFDSLIAIGDSAIPAHAAVFAVPNARDTVDSAGRIEGPERPGVLHSKESWAALVLGLAEPLAGAVFFTAFQGEEVERHRRIAYAPGVELTARLVAPLALRAWETVAPIPKVSTEALEVLERAPFRAVTAGGHRPADVVTIALVGSPAEVASAFATAGWTEAAASSLRADIATLWAAARALGYGAQPVSTLEIDGAPPRFVFEKVVNSMARRDHIRIWQWGGAVGGRELWLVTATRDNGVRFSRAQRSFTHRVNPDVDAEREKVLNDLLAAGVVNGSSYLVRRAPAEPVMFNDGQSHVQSDWRLAVVELARRQ